MEMLQVRKVCHRRAAAGPRLQERPKTLDASHFVATQLKACLCLVVAHVRLVARVGIRLGRLLH